ncbi:MAG: DUF1311 domain-containing protein [Lysobacteraceae bacterium]|nr:MAG: DUF1311 domain-containing protein [Xanthomonadaceae bacterium]
MQMKNMRILATILIADTFGSDPVTAQGSRDVTGYFSRNYPACITYGEAHNTVAIPQNECDARELRAQDARLNAAYRAVIVRLPFVRRADLRTDERKWILARDHKCGKLPDPDLTTECKINETIKRTAYLRHYK